MAEMASPADPGRRSAWRSVLSLWPLVPLLVGVVLISGAKQRYEEYVSVDVTDIAVLAGSGRPVVVCGSDYERGGLPSVALDRCDALIAARAPATRTMFWAGVVLVVVGAALLARRVGLRRSWPFLAAGGAVACWYALFWLWHLPLEGGTCGSVWDGGELGHGPGDPCRSVVDRANTIASAIFLAMVVLGASAAVALIRRGLALRRRAVPT